MNTSVKHLRQAILTGLGALLFVPIFISADSISGIVGDPNPCYVPIYHTHFTFPPEGGQIVQSGDQLYFYRNYQPGCQNVPPPTNLSGFNSAYSSSSYYQPNTSYQSVYVQKPVYQQPVYVTQPIVQQAVPRYSAPVTGCYYR
jgi:hypothetical protein